MTTAPPPLPRTGRPTGAAIIGMLYMIFGGIGVIGSAIGVAAVPLIGRVAEDVAIADPALEAYLDAFASPVFPLLLAMGLVQTSVVTVAGWGLWTMKPWGRRFGEGASWLWLATTLISTVISYSWIRDLMTAAADLGGEPVPDGFDAMMNAITIGSIVFNVVLYGGLLAWAIYYLRKPSVRAAYGD